jgi:hypothetical protein
MARPKKIGLEYFPMDCKLDIKVEMLETMHGNDGFALWIKLLQEIYQTEKGEFNFSDILRRKTIAKRANISEEQLKNIVSTCVEVGLFDKEAFETAQILTSTGVRKRLQKVEHEREMGRDRAEKYSTAKNTRRTGESKSRKKKDKDNGDSLLPTAENTIILPFESEDFKKAWSAYKSYRKSEHGFGYKGPDSESAALRDLFTLSKGNESYAIRCINYSMAKGWKGIFDAKDINGKSQPLPESSAPLDKPDLRGNRNAFKNSVFSHREVYFKDLDLGIAKQIWLDINKSPDDFPMDLFEIEYTDYLNKQKLRNRVS